MHGYEFDNILVGDDGTILDSWGAGLAGSFHLHHVVPIVGAAGDVITFYRTRDAMETSQETWTLQCTVLPLAGDTIDVIADDNYTPSADAQLGRRSDPSNGLRFEFGSVTAGTDIFVPIGATILASMQNLVRAIYQAYLDQNLPVTVAFDGVDTITLTLRLPGNPTAMIVESTGAARFTAAQSAAGTDPVIAAASVLDLPLEGLGGEITVEEVFTEGLFAVCSASASARLFYRYTNQAPRLSGFVQGAVESPAIAF